MPNSYKILSRVKGKEAREYLGHNDEFRKVRSFTSLKEAKEEFVWLSAHSSFKTYLLIEITKPLDDDVSDIAAEVTSQIG